MPWQASRADAVPVGPRRGPAPAVSRAGRGISASSLVLAVGAGFAALLVSAAPARPLQAGTAPETKYAALLDGARDEILRRAFVPSELLRQGEVRLVRRGDGAVMQTVISSAFLPRVVGGIRRKELASWPPERRGHDDSQRYIAALGKAASEARSPKLLIEFILTRRASIVVLYEPSLSGPEEEYRIASKRPIAVLELSRTYVRGDIYEIARDALRLDGKEAAKVLEAVLPGEGP